MSTRVFQMFESGKTSQFVPGIGSAPAAEGTTTTDPRRTAPASAFAARERVSMVRASASRPSDLDRCGSGGWSRRSDSNRRPAAYKAAALPLSYAGARASLAAANHAPHKRRWLAKRSLTFPLGLARQHERVQRRRERRPTTLSDPTRPRIGSRTSTSHACRVSRAEPLPSEPSTTATRPSGAAPPRTRCVPRARPGRRR